MSFITNSQEAVLPHFNDEYSSFEILINKNLFTKTTLPHDIKTVDAFIIKKQNGTRILIEIGDLSTRLALATTLQTHKELYEEFREYFRILIVKLVDARKILLHDIKRNNLIRNPKKMKERRFDYYNTLYVMQILSIYLIDIIDELREGF